MLATGAVELLDDKTLLAELRQLERRTRAGGKDSVSHPPGGHDDAAVSAAGAIHLAGAKRTANWDASDVFFGPSLVSANPDWEGPGGLAPWDMH